MQDRPDLGELLAGVREFLEKDLVPAVSEPRLRFQVRVAANLLAVAAREAALEADLLQGEARRIEGLLGRTPEPARAGEPPGAALRGLRRRVEELSRELAARIRSGAIDASPGSAVWEHLRRTAQEKLQVAKPAG